jgi:hypothetical protein
MRDQKLFPVELLNVRRTGMSSGYEEQVDKSLGSDSTLADYLLCELAHLQAINRDISSHVLQRVNLHIAIVSGVVALIVFLGQTAFHDQTALFLLSLLLAATLALGLLIYAEMVQWVITDIYIDRVSAQIKRFFQDQYPSLSRYLGLPYDDRPVHIRRRSLRSIITTNLGSKQIVTFLNNSMAGAVGACVVFGCDPVAYRTAAIVGSTMFVLVWALQFVYARMRYRLWEEASRKYIRFPAMLAGEDALSALTHLSELEHSSVSRKR